MSGIVRRALVVSPFMMPEMAADRPTQFVTALREHAEVDVVTSDFCHHRKIQVREQIYGLRVNVHALGVPHYRSNVGFARFWSHLVFMRRACTWLHRHGKNYDIVYCTAPFSLLAYSFFRNQPHALRLLDIIDFWPDSLPFPRWVRYTFWPLFQVWRSMNRLAPMHADHVLSGSSHFLAKARAVAADKPEARFHYVQLASNSGLEQPAPLRSWSGYVMVIAYVGNIGSLIDWDSLLDAAKNRGRRVLLQIVGEGDARKQLIRELQCRDIPFAYHGIVYDRETLSGILRSAHFGYNGYRNTDASFSYKATTYLDNSLPILNSMSGDLRNQICEYGSGLNFEDSASLTRNLATLSRERYTRLTLGIEAHRRALHQNGGCREIVDLLLSRRCWS